MDNITKAVLAIGGAYLLYKAMGQQTATSVSNPNSVVVWDTSGNSAALRGSLMGVQRRPRVNRLGEYVYTASGMKNVNQPTRFNPAPPVKMKPNAPVNDRWSDGATKPNTVPFFSEFINAPKNEQDAEIAYAKAHPNATGVWQHDKQGNVFRGPLTPDLTAPPSEAVYVNGTYQGQREGIASAMLQNLTGNPNMTPAGLMAAAARSSDPGYQAAASLALQRYYAQQGH